MDGYNSPVQTKPVRIVTFKKVTVVFSQKLYRNLVELSLPQAINQSKSVCDVAAIVRSHTSGLLPFEKTIEQKIETMPLALKQ